MIFFTRQKRRDREEGKRFAHWASSSLKNLRMTVGPGAVQSKKKKEEKEKQDAATR